MDPKKQALKKLAEWVTDPDRSSEALDLFRGLVSIEDDEIEDWSPIDLDGESTYDRDVIGEVAVLIPVIETLAGKPAGNTFKNFLSQLEDECEDDDPDDDDIE